MSSLTNVNNNSSVVNVGRTTPVSPGQQPAAKSIPVVLATDQTAIPVVEQNKIQSEVALSLLGIPRAEVALGIFADVNTYDVNPTEWSPEPAEYLPGYGIKHLPEEAGALVQAPKNETAILTSKRFFRYQPGRVSAGTFGVKSTLSPTPDINLGQSDLNPSIRKFGVFDKFDGYYWETRADGQGDNFCVVRRTQSLLKNIPVKFGNAAGNQTVDHGIAGKGPNAAPSTYNQYPIEYQALINNRFSLAKFALDPETEKCRRDIGYILDGLTYDMTLGTNYNARFLGFAELNSIEAKNYDANNPRFPASSPVIARITSSRTYMLTTPGLSSVTSSATVQSEVNKFYTDLLDILQNGRAAADALTFSNPTTASAAAIAAKDKLVANRAFIINEVNAYVAAYIAANNLATDHNVDKCTRDIGYAVDGFCYDILYGGNSATFDGARFFLYADADNNPPSILPTHKLATIAAYNRLRDIVGPIVQGNAIPNPNASGQVTSGNNATVVEANALASLAQVIANVIDKGATALPTIKVTPSTTWAGAAVQSAKTQITSEKGTILESVVPKTYTTNDLKCLRDLDFAIDAYAYDLRWGGNAYTIANARNYNEIANVAAQLSLDEVTVHTRLQDGIVNLFNTIQPSNPASTRISSLASILIGVVDSGNVNQYAPISSINYGAANPLTTIMTAKKHFYGYAVSEKDSNGNAIVYDTSEGPVGVTEAELKYKCQRDVRYVIEGYLRDLIGGGDAGTKFNAKKYYSGDQSLIFSQESEIARHTYLKSILLNMLSTYGLTQYRSKLSTLCDFIIANFSAEQYGEIVFGDEAQFGDLIIYRDNLVMVHAAVYDPSLLLPRKKVVVSVDAGNETLTAAEGAFITDQYIVFAGDASGADHAGLTAGKLYKVGKVSGVKSNVITLVDPVTNNNVSLSPASTTIYIEPNNPFVFPKEYFTGMDPENPSGLKRYDGMFPLMYVGPNDTLPATDEQITLNQTVGFIDTAIDTSANAKKLKDQIDAVNLKYNNWVKENVDPLYWGVYEYRVPRSRFSTDQLNGQTNKVVYSDIATSADGKAYAGQPVLSSLGVQAEATSAWNMDFTKVTMLKIEYSWYGAVGALFLAYVPVSNGEARWVRVHHLRCSNQFKIPSLGNATLPITYLTYGGGSVSRLGIANNSTAGKYESTSEHIVKYGASYYIDGGDRGTVRLYSYSSDTPTDVVGAKYNIGDITSWNGSGSAPTGPHIATDTLGTYINVAGATGSTLPSNKVFFMGAKVVTTSREDQNIEVVWVSGTKLYISKGGGLASNNGVALIANRPSVVFGLKAKDNILNSKGVAVRNRVQVYPTKLSTANLGDRAVRMKVLKTPYFQPQIATTGSMTLSEPYTISANNPPLPISVESSPYITTDGDFVYGWFRADIGTVFGKLYKEGGNYYFTLLQTFSVSVKILSGIAFLPEGRFDFEGNTLTSNTESRVEKERLSSVYISTQVQCPVPDTGIEVASFYLKSGSDQFDLLSYFDYNKDYLSYPLTNQLESLYLVADNSQLVSQPNIEITASLTWEEQ